MAIPFDDIKALVKRNSGQMTVEEYARVYDEIERVAPGKVMVFGAGRDSFLWLRANQDGETYFVDDDPRWLAEAERAHVADRGNWRCITIQVKYWTKLEEWRKDLDVGSALMMPELAHIGRPSMDLVLVDGPHGEGRRAPGRGQSIYMASELTKKGGTVLVHDMHRMPEKMFGARYLGGPVKDLTHHLGVWRM